MAVILLNPAIKTFLGLAADAKPTTDVPAGSSFLETDSGAVYVYDGAAWQLRLDLGPFRASKTVTFTGAANLGQLNTNTTLFTVTGEVQIVAIVPFCTTDLAGALGQVSLGITGALALFIAATLGTDIDANEFWVDTTPDPNGVALPAALKDIAITDNILAAVTVADLTGGVLRVDVYWRPLSANGNVVAA